MSEPLRSTLTVPLVALLSSASSSRLVVAGPEYVVVLGVAVPLISAGAGMLGVVLGQLLAPAPAEPLGLKRRSALVIALLAIAVASVIATGQQVLVALGWGIGLGFSGLAVAETLGGQAKAGLKTISDAFIAAIAARVGGGKDKTGEP